ncbi:hypothetical protein PLICBS_007733 [Purpureocillium lilacinum]|uniref:uncharacterized protein n=1 Tax=Purpureocillium lilacinum TaxID=33203 RepID=UPI002084D96E|nr:hypothetical protein PLICBS_007733 [Purpureocillium lilacinum]
MNNNSDTNTSDKGKLMMSVLRGEMEMAADVENPGHGDGGSGVSGMSRLEMDAVLLELLQGDTDLKLWLEHTHYFDLAHRERVVEGMKKLRAVEEEREKLLQELHGTAGPGVSGPVAGPTYTPAPESALEGRVIGASSMATPNFMMPSCETASFSEGSFANAPAASTAAPGSPSGAVVAVAAGHSARRTSPDLLKVTRFFLVKCFNTSNVYMSQRDGLWMTQAKNGPAFTEAFEECESVVLFFSINKSHGFQGVARMTSAPDASIPMPDWMANVNLPAVTDPFRIEWITKTETDFERFGGLFNPLNEGRPVVVGRDGLEYPAYLGRKMMELMMTAADEKMNAIPAIPPKVGSVSTVSSATNVAPGTPPVPEGVAFQGRLAHKRRGRETRGRSGSPTDNTDKVRTRKDWRVRDTVLPKSPQAKAELGPAYSEPAGLSLQPPSSDSDSRHLGHSEPVDLIEL